ncbi:hypothetical protein [Daejeonella sp.]|uniref:endonuclease/exonuclease/phosphatase family protein n=1 Tax=Daejeonella sp. TaxID=2805397 RepID=UPI00272524AA|nr:hypothetical protein [Daejeonella sp.]MDO8992179.1 hypothetical protein [Daejeonella sp.]MDP2413367.1 hypothetical protein [Daejeonella sp.]
MKRFLILAIFGFLGSSSVLAQKMNVMSYNIHIGQNSANHDQLMGIAQYIQDSKIDIIGLQDLIVFVIVQERLIR